MPPCSTVGAQERAATIFRTRFAAWTLGKAGQRARCAAALMACWGLGHHQYVDLVSPGGLRTNRSPDSTCTSAAQLSLSRHLPAPTSCACARRTDQSIGSTSPFAFSSFEHVAVSPFVHVLCAILSRLRTPPDCRSFQPDSDDDQSKGLVPALRSAHCSRVAPHMQHVLSCIPAAEHHSREALCKDPRLRHMMHNKATLNAETGKLVDRAGADQPSSVASNSHSSTKNTVEWLKTQAARTWNATSAPCATPHAVSCCCLSCSLRHKAEHPAPTFIYHRLSTHEAGNSRSFLKDPDLNAAASSARSSHPQIPHGYQSLPSRPLHSAPDAGSAPHFERKHLPLSQAIRGGAAHACLFNAHVDGLIDS